MLTTTIPFLRPAELLDIPYLVTIENEQFDYDRLSRRQFLYHTAKQPSGLFVLDVGGANKDVPIAGYILFFYRKNSPSIYLNSIAVSSVFQGNGYGKKMLVESEVLVAKYGRFIHAHSKVTNTRMHHLFFSAEWERYNGIESDFYTDGTSAYCFRKKLNS